MTNTGPNMKCIISGPELGNIMPQAILDISQMLMWPRPAAMVEDSL